MYRLVDDLDQSLDDVRTTKIAVGDESFEVDLSAANRAKLAEVLEPFRNAARARAAQDPLSSSGIELVPIQPVATPEPEPEQPAEPAKNAPEPAPAAKIRQQPKATGAKAGKAPQRSRPSTREERDAKLEEGRKVRAWAAANGISVSDRGRISHEIMEKYRKAQEAESVPA